MNSIKAIGLAGILGVLVIIVVTAYSISSYQPPPDPICRSPQIPYLGECVNPPRPKCCWKGLVTDTREYTERPGIFDRPRQDVTIRFLEGPSDWGNTIAVTIECTYYRVGDTIEKIDRGDDFYDGILGEHWRLWGLPSKCDYVRA